MSQRAGQGKSQFPNRFARQFAEARATADHVERGLGPLRSMLTNLPMAPDAKTSFIYAE
jgi:hypothetical protein